MSPFLSPMRLSPTGVDTDIAEVLRQLLGHDLPVRLTAYDSSSTGPQGVEVGLHLATPRALAYLLTSPGSLGLARAYVMGDLELLGVHPGDPYPLLDALTRLMPQRKIDAAAVVKAARAVGLRRLIPPEIPAQEAAPDWRRRLDGLVHSRTRDAHAISHHYDVSNRFYELVLGDSMTYTCALFTDESDTLEQAQAAKYDLVAKKLALAPGMRLLDVGCGWGSMVRHAVQNYGVTALGVTLSREQAAWGQHRIKELGLEDRAEIRHLDYRDVTETDFDAISSIGLTEHIGVANYPSYFASLKDRLRPGGRLLNHCITRPDNRHVPRVRGGFIDRYIFPDGELTGAGRIFSEIQDAGFEVRHSENLREHYALTLRQWSLNLAQNWDEAVEEASEATARIWGLYLSGCQVGFEQNWVQLHQILAVRPDGADARMPLRPNW